MDTCAQCGCTGYHAHHCPRHHLREAKVEKTGGHGPSCGQAYEEGKLDGFSDGEDSGIELVKRQIRTLLVRVRATPDSSPGAVREIQKELERMLE